MPLAPDQETEVANARANLKVTSRPTVPAMEEILHSPFFVLDHGFVRVVDYMGDDAAIVQAARVSYGMGTKSVRDDEGLINYLMRHRHTTPFEMCEIKLHVKLPIFVARQWIRHRTANVNEYSGRYSILDREFYVPEPDVLAAQSKKNRQGRDEVVSAKEAREVLTILKEDVDRSYDHYLVMLNEGEGSRKNRLGIARELARMNLSLNFYTQWYWKIDLHNLLHFLSLRADPHAQYEIRAYAEIMLREIVRRWMPIVYDTFLNHRLNAVTFSEREQTVLARMLGGEAVEQTTSGLNPAEWREFEQKIAKVREQPER